MRKAALILAIIAISFCFSMWLAEYTYNTDFPAFYRTAKIITDPNVPNVTVYDRDLSAERYDYQSAFVEYRYSMLVAYLLAPLAYLPYNTAKAVMIFVNILAYLGGVAITLRLLGATGRWFFYTLALSLLWPPFIQDLRFAQPNSVIFLLVAAGVYFATQNRPHFCGSLIGLACMFKAFPIAIALVLGLKNWRILAGCFVTVGLALLLPGTPEWFTSFLRQPFIPDSYSPVLQLLGHGGFAVFATIIALTTAIIAYRHRATDYVTLTALAVPAMFLAAPIVEYYHLVFVTLPLCWLLFDQRRWAIVPLLPLVLGGGWLMVAGLLLFLVLISQKVCYQPRVLLPA